jgi:hypothetical protein
MIPVSRDRLRFYEAAGSRFHTILQESITFRPFVSILDCPECISQFLHNIQPIAAIISFHDAVMDYGSGDYASSLQLDESIAPAAAHGHQRDIAVTG